ncbi:MAG: hypothetical protein LBO62_04060 [Endomicrobium sp.]|jgi:hypothetical protein|nr:hypothetical protein [Endomicrobium sp.]
MKAFEFNSAIANIIRYKNKIKLKTKIFQFDREFAENKKIKNMKHPADSRHSQVTTIIYINKYLKAILLEIKTEWFFYIFAIQKGFSNASYFRNREFFISYKKFEMFYLALEATKI